MIELRFVGDGPRDEAVVPRLVEKIIGTEVAGDFHAWKELRLHKSGYHHRLEYAAGRARRDGKKGLIATVDQDKAKRRVRLQQLAKGREQARHASNLPIAIGEARPELEDWLLDDQEAVKQVLGIEATAPMPRDKNKETLNSLIDNSSNDGERIEILADIALALDAQRCRNASGTGFEEFTKVVENEIGPLRAASD